MLMILKLVFNKMLVMRPAAILKYDVGTSICHFFWMASRVLRVFKCCILVTIENMKTSFFVRFGGQVFTTNVYLC